MITVVTCSFYFIWFLGNILRFTLAMLSILNIFLLWFFPKFYWLGQRAFYRGNMAKDMYRESQCCDNIRNRCANKLKDRFDVEKVDNRTQVWHRVEREAKVDAETHLCARTDGLLPAPLWIWFSCLSSILYHTIWDSMTWKRKSN